MHSPERFGNFLLIERLGEGSTGVADLARPVRRSPHRPALLVVKRLHEALCTKRPFVQRFRHEALIAVSVDSPHVAKIYGVGKVGRTYFIAMEYLAGWKVQRVLHALAEQERRPSVGALVGAIAGALRGLHALHEARHPRTHEPLLTVHRDLSPNNLILGRDGALRIIDMGLGKSRAQDWRTVTGAIIGSLGYIAPEQIRGEDVDRRSDLYSIAVILQELLTLRPFIPRADRATMLMAAQEPAWIAPSSIRSDVPSALDDLLRRALSADPNDRPASAEIFYDELLAAVPTADVAPDELGNIVADDPELARRDALADEESEPPVEQEPEELTELFAERTVVDPRPALRRPLPTVAGTPSRRAPPRRSSSERRPIVRHLPGQRTGVPAAAVVVLMCLAVVTTLAVDRFFFFPSNVVVKERIVTPPATPSAVPEARPSRGMASTTVPPPGPPPQDRPCETSSGRVCSKPPGRTRGAPRPVPTERRASAPPPSEGAVSPFSVSEEVGRLTRRAQAIRARHPERAAAIDQLVAEISIWAAASDESKARQALRRAGARLNTFARKDESED